MVRLHENCAIVSPRNKQIDASSKKLSVSSLRQCRAGLICIVDTRPNNSSVLLSHQSMITHAIRHFSGIIIRIAQIQGLQSQHHLSSDSSFPSSIAVGFTFRLVKSPKGFGSVDFREIEGRPRSRKLAKWRCFIVKHSICTQFWRQFFVILAWHPGT